MAMNAYRNYNQNTSSLSKNLEKLSSGYKINRAGDDAAGLAISEKMRAQITGLNAAQKNVKDGISLVKTAEGAMQEIQDMLNRMDYLATQSANGTYQNEVDRENLQKEVTSLKSEINRIADSANFNGIKLLDGSLGGGKISVDGVTFSGANVASAEAAKMTTATIKADLTAADATKATQDYLSIDGKKVTIDWANNLEAKQLAGQLTSDLSAATDETIKSIAKDFESVINNSAKAQGVNASVTVSADSTGVLTIKSNNKGVDSEFSFLGSNAAIGDIATSIMSGVIMGGSGNGAASINKATLTYNGKSLAANDVFQMDINGTKVDVKMTGAITDGTTTMTAAATQLQTDIQTAIDTWNTANGLTAGTYDPKSGLTGLTKADFTVTVGDNGNFVIKYGGEEDVTFSFKDVGDRSFAQNLGLANGTSQSGGSTGLTLQIGDTADSFNQLNVSINDMHVNALGIGGVDIGSIGGAQSAISVIKDAINNVSATRGDLGAIQNRLEHTQKNLSVMAENIQDAEANIRDTDVAEEMMAYTKNNILIQSAQAMLAQANQVPQGVLQLLG